MRWIAAVLIFGGIGAVACIGCWFGVTHPRFQFEYQREIWARASPERVRRLKRGLLVGLVLAELFIIGAGLAITAAQG